MSRNWLGDLTPGPRRELNARIRRLRERAGNPPFSTMASEIDQDGCRRATLQKIITDGCVPRRPEPLAYLVAYLISKGPNFAGDCAKEARECERLRKLALADTAGSASSEAALRTGLVALVSLAFATGMSLRVGAGMGGDYGLLTGLILVLLGFAFGCLLSRSWFMWVGGSISTGLIALTLISIMVSVPYLETVDGMICAVLVGMAMSLMFEKIRRTFDAVGWGGVKRAILVVSLVVAAGLAFTFAHVQSAGQGPVGGGALWMIIVAVIVASGLFGGVDGTSRGQHPNM